MSLRLIFLFLFAAALSVAEAQVPNPTAAPVEGSDNVKIRLPGNSVNDVLSLYEILTGKRLVRESNLGGSPITLVVPGSISRAEAISLLESALMLNGYTLVPSGGNTIKVLGGRSPLGEGIPLFADPAQLPPGEQVVSYFMPLRYIGAKDALTVFQSYVTTRKDGKMVEVPGGNAIVITDSSTLIRRLLDLQRLIDVPGARVLTEFVTLTRASAETVAETVNKLLEEEKKPKEGVPPVPASTQVVADERTNRILIVAPEMRMPYLRKLVMDLDDATVLDAPLEWPLKFVLAGEVLPVLEQILSEGKEAEGKGTDANSAQQQDLQYQQSQSQAADNIGYGNTSGGGGGNIDAALSGGPDKLKEPRENSAPLAVSVGKARIIADRSANKIIVIGPPEVQTKASSVLKMLDQRPKQVYLATIIGQLRLGDDLDYGIQYPDSVKVSLGTYPNGQPYASANSNTLPNASTAANTANAAASTGLDMVPGTNELLNSAFQIASTTALPMLSGLTIYGIIGDSIDVYLRALQSTNRFKVISRPVIYTSNNKKATISSGQLIPVPVSSTSAITNVGPANNGTAVTSDIQYQPVVLKLEVIPLINSNDEVTLTIFQKNDTVISQTQVANNTVPVVGTQQLMTTVTVRNRQTVVLGGLITEEEEDGKSGLPLLSSIPYLGSLFGTTKKNLVRRELVVLIQPMIINSENDLAAANQMEKKMTDLGESFWQGEVPSRRAKEAEKKIKKMDPKKQPPATTTTTTTTIKNN